MKQNIDKYLTVFLAKFRTFKKSKNLKVHVCKMKMSWGFFGDYFQHAGIVYYPFLFYSTTLFSPVSMCDLFVDTYLSYDIL